MSHYLFNLKRCKRLPNEESNLTIYEVPRKEIMRQPSKMIAKCQIGDPQLLNTCEKVIILVGATGTGKSTLINGITNYILGVNWNDRYRFKLIIEESNQSQIHSQTSWITAYSFHPMKGSKMSHAITIIDTPGFGDTRGIDRDKEIIGQIKEYFSLHPPVGIDQLHAVVFVTQSSLARLTPTQRYIFDSILAVFGRDIADNIHLMTTFADGKKPPVLKAVEGAGVPYVATYKVNNSALYAQNTDMFGEMFWKMGYESFTKFFSEIENVEPTSLQLTKEVLKERQRLETVIKGLQPQIQSGLSKIDEIQQERKTLEMRESEVLANKEFTYRVNMTKQIKIDLECGEYVTNCLTCNCTCHFPCHIPNDADKYRCWAMDSERMDSRCRICDGKCSWKEHVNNPYRFELYTEEVEKTSADLKKKYEKALEGRKGVHAIIECMENELKQSHRQVIQNIQEARHCLERLQDIALKPNPLSEVEYIDLLIESEKSEAKKGFRNRIQALEKLRDQAVILMKMKEANLTEEYMESNWDIWRDKK